jgi:hypothetical protein
MTYGGFGRAAHGRHRFGASSTEVEPRFNYISKPVNGSYNVPRDQWVEYETYFFSSSMPENVSEGLGIRISEDGGATWADAFSAPYTATVRRKDGQTLWVKISKSSEWADNQEIVIEHTSPDEFGNAAVSQYPVRWT